MMTPDQTFLIADDHALMRMALHDLVLELIPESTVLQTDSPDTISTLVDSEPGISFILLDLFMPGHDIFSVIKEIHQSHPNIKIIVISASEKKQHIRKAFEYGIHSYIPKSSDMPTINSALQSIFAGEKYIPDFYNMDNDIDNEDIVVAGLTMFKPEQIESILTNRQLEIFQLLGEGKSNKEIASKMYISVNTVKIHVSAILKSLNLVNRSQAGILSRSVYH